MAIDAYSLCPGGTGKKIKFCCPDFVHELDKIDRMIDGEQFQNCLQHIDRLLAEGEPRQCLMALRGWLLRVTNQFEEAVAHVAEFLRLYPENPFAWAEAAVLTAAGESGRAAVPKLQRAIALSGKVLQNRVYDAIGMVAEVLTEEGDWSAARALWVLLLALVPDDERSAERLMAMNLSPDIPLLLKEDRRLMARPDNPPWKDHFDEADKAIRSARWQEGVELLTALSRDYPDVPAIWHNLAMLRGWLADDDAAIDAWRTFARLQVPHDDAVEAETLAMMLSADPLGDGIDWLLLNWPVRDAERFHESLLSDRRIVQVPFDPTAMAREDSPPPRLVGILLDRPVHESAEDLSLDTMPRVLGQVQLFGRQTDRDARLEVQGLTSSDLDRVQAVLRGIGGENLGAEFEQKAAGRASQSHQLLTNQWLPPRDASREQIDSLAAQQRRRALLEQWPEIPLGVLDGRAPREAAADPTAANRVLAAVAMMEHWCERTPGTFDFNELRVQLGLPLEEPIELSRGEIGRLPLVRLVRVKVDALSDEDLRTGFRRAVQFRAWKAVRPFAAAVIARPGAQADSDRLLAYRMLAQSAESVDEALEHVRQGREAFASEPKTCASWDLLELSYRFAQGDPREAMRLVQHVESRHMDEPGVGEAMTRMLIQVGLLRPDGTPAMPMPRGESPAAAAPPAAESSRLWTPGSDPAGGGGGGKLWTPG
jgi:tetratricopeptide (TPR) repeat protein